MLNRKKRLGAAIVELEHRRKKDRIEADQRLVAAMAQDGVEVRPPVPPHGPARALAAAFAIFAALVLVAFLVSGCAFRIPTELPVFATKAQNVGPSTPEKVKRDGPGVRTGLKSRKGWV